MKCPNCGEEIANESVFCEFCGTQIVKAITSSACCKVDVKWLLYVAMLFIYGFNYSISWTPCNFLSHAVFFPLLVQLSIFLFASFLRYKKRIATLVLISSLFMLIVNFLFLYFIGALFDGTLFDDTFDSFVRPIDFFYVRFLHISPLILLLCMMYEFYSYKKARK